MVLNHDYSNEPKVSDIPVTLLSIPRILILFLIRAYQKIISPALPANTCRFYPTCSHYTYQAIYRYGVLHGSWLGLKRVLRCNPLNPGGFDPVPAVDNKK